LAMIKIFESSIHGVSTKVPLQTVTALLVVLLYIGLFPLASSAIEQAILFRETFNNLDNWQPFFFPKIKNHTKYSIEKSEGLHCLRAESKASASAIVYKDSFNVYEYPRVAWRWKVSNVYAKGDARTKEGDDYPMRVYIMFEYDPAQAGAVERMRYGLMKMLYGKYPPHSSLSYVWANKDDPETIMTSPYTDRAKMVFLEKGVRKVGTWQDETVNVVEDYQKAFGTNPPARARIAIMNDSDNTGESSMSYMEYIEVFK